MQHLETEAAMPYPTTRTTLLNRLNGDEAAWKEFFRRYRSAVADIGRCKGLSPDECADLVQFVQLDRGIVPVCDKEARLKPIRGAFTFCGSGLIIAETGTALANALDNPYQDEDMRDFLRKLLAQSNPEFDFMQIEFY